MKAKKILSVIAALVILMCSVMPLTAFAAGSSTGFTATEVSGKKGEKVYVELKLDKPCEACTFRIYLTYDATALKAVTRKWGEAMTIDNASTNEKNGKICVLGLSYDGKKTLSKAGTIVTLGFNILDTAEVGKTYPIKLSIENSGDLVDTNTNIVTYTLTDGSITVTDGEAATTQKNGEETTSKSGSNNETTTVAEETTSPYEANTNVDPIIEKQIENKINELEGNTTNQDVQTNNTDSDKNKTTESKKTGSGNPFKVIELTKAFGADANENKAVVDVPSNIDSSQGVKVYKYDVPSDSLVEIDCKVENGKVSFDALGEGYYVIEQKSGMSNTAKTAIIVCSVVGVLAVAGVVVFIVIKKKKPSEITEQNSFSDNNKEE
ncbi:MAG: hypothetical protein K5917_02485 [Clostridiales bacterium]|nr:hypothetical protein [Clostridiales bacterium]